MATKHFKVEPLKIDKFVSVNELEACTNPIFFDMNNAPTSEGLLSNQIFGITKDERSNTFAYIDLGKNEVFIHPLCYRIWTKIDRHIKEIVHGTRKVRIDKHGELIDDDENGECGIKFLYKNFNKIKIKRTESSKRDAVIEFLNKYQDRMWIHQMVVIPAYYRDVSTTGKYVGVGDINQIYSKLITAATSLSESQDFGLNLSDSIRGKIQELLGQLYDYFTKGVFNGEPVTGIAGKFGILRKANLSKTTDYSSRIVLSAPELRTENIEDMITNLDYSAVPLASITANYYPYMIFYMRRFFENMFAGNEQFPFIDSKTGKPVTADISDYQIQFNDERLKEELDRFAHGIANRFRPIEVIDKKAKKTYQVRLLAYNITKEEYNKIQNKEEIKEYPILNRPMTWCDLIYIAACEVTKDKVVLITRYPMDSYFNQFPTKVNVSSTKDTVPMVVGTEFYPFYPLIRPEDLNTDTTNKFTDTLKICNLYLASIGGDYDGDQVSIKSLYSIEANDELAKQMQSKSHYISLSGECILETDIEGMQSIYNLTMILREDKNKLTNPEF